MYSEELIILAISENIYILIYFGADQITSNCFSKMRFVALGII